MDKLFNMLTYVIGFLFLLMGLQWLVDPTSAAAGLGMSLLSGHGLSTQIGDLASFFLVVGIFTLCAAVKKDKVWLYTCLLYTSPSPRDGLLSRMPSSA